jgi:ABC-2 type transport system permease protein
LINLGLNLIVVAIFMALDHVSLLDTVILLPLLIFEVYILALGASLFLAAAFVKFRDVIYIWEVILQAGFYATPILYALSIIPNVTYQKILLLNPMAQAIQDARYATITHSPLVITIWRIFDNGWYVFVPFVIVILVAILGLVYFRKESKYFAENI